MIKSHYLFTLVLMVFIYPLLRTDAKEPSKQLNINIISNNNGVGLSRDIDILTIELTKLGHTVRFTEDKVVTPQPKTDINIFVQPLNANYLPYADKNYLIPNHEWCYFSPEELLKFDKILCKTKEAERIFKAIHPNTSYIGFTCKDRYQENVEKNYNQFFHLAGASSQKGTEKVIRTWLENPQFPSLTILRHKKIDTLYPPVSNLKLIREYLSDTELLRLQNENGIHVCPSESEGFGYYIFEALSVGAVVVTTDAPPMNEFVKDKRCLVGYNHTAPLNYATNYYFDQRKMENTITELVSLPNKELQEIGKKNRELYLENDRQFKMRIEELFGSGQ